MAAELGCKTLDSSDIAAGTVAITTSHTSIAGNASVEYTKSFLGKQERISRPRITNVSGGNLSIVLGPGDKVGHMLCWTSYDS